MTGRPVYSRIFVALALLGVLLAPLGPSIAAPMMMAMEMPAGMECCPDAGAQPSGCAGDCPFVALCVASHISVVAPAALAAGAAIFVDLRLMPATDRPLRSRLSEPPARPPRI